jgi:hypothetical protein
MVVVDECLGGAGCLLCRLCFMRADINMLHTLANASQGCVVAIVGDYHYSDLKAILPGPDHKYASILGTASLRRPRRALPVPNAPATAA